MLSCTHRGRALVSHAMHFAWAGGRRSTLGVRCCCLRHDAGIRIDREAGSNGRRTRLHAGQRLQPSATACCRRCSAKEVGPVQQAKESRHRGRNWHAPMSPLTGEVHRSRALTSAISCSTSLHCRYADSHGVRIQARRGTSSAASTASVLAATARSRLLGWQAGAG